MTNKSDNFREKLYEEYEDSLFRLIMNDTAEKEGKFFLEEKYCLQKNSKNQPSPEKIEIFNQQLNSIFKERHKYNRRKFIFRALNKVAVVVLVLVGVFSTAMVTVEAFRVDVLNFLINIQPEYTSFQMQNNTSDSKGEEMVVNWTNTYLPTYIPDSYEVNSLTYTDPLKAITYRNKKNKDLLINFIINNSSNNVEIDTENASVLKTIKVNGNKGTLVVKNSQTTIVWEMDHHIFTVCTMESIDETLKIAQNVKFVK